MYKERGRVYINYNIDVEVQKEESGGVEFRRSEESPPEERGKGGGWV